MSTTAKTIKIGAPGFTREWLAPRAELRVLRAFCDEVMSRRAFSRSHGMAMEEPDYFMASIVETKTRFRRLLDSLEIEALNSRELLLATIARLGEIQDAWFAGPTGPDRQTGGAPQLFPGDRMARAWPKVEEVRLWLEQVCHDVEASAAFRKRTAG